MSVRLTDWINSRGMGQLTIQDSLPARRWSRRRNRAWRWSCICHPVPRRAASDRNISADCPGVAPPQQARVSNEPSICAVRLTAVCAREITIFGAAVAARELATLQWLMHSPSLQEASHSQVPLERGLNSAHREARYRALSMKRIT